MVMGWHQAVGDDINQRIHILPPAAKEKEIILFLEENPAPVIAAVVEVVVVIWQEGGESSGHVRLEPGLENSEFFKNSEF
jgi:hypothetical protein